MKKRTSVFDEFKKHKLTYIVAVILRLVLVASIVLAALRSDWETIFYSALALLLCTLPAVVERKFPVVFPVGLEVTILLFIFAANFLGELRSFYLLVPHWDTMLHTINGFISAAVGFSLLDLINRNNLSKFSLSPLYLCIVSVCFSTTIGVVWEFFEYFMDCFVHTDMQKDTIISGIYSVMLNETGVNKPVSIPEIYDMAINGEMLPVTGYLDIGLHDTMKDLIVTFIGASLFNALGYIYLASRGKRHKLLELFIPQADTEENSATH